MDRSDTLGKLAPALVACQGDLKVVPKAHKAGAGSYSYTYASLPDLWEHARPILSKHGLAVVQTFDGSDGSTLNVTTMLLHASGEWISGTQSFPIVDTKPQTLGSLGSYGRRYGFAAILGLVSDEDDDAQQAQRASEKSAAPERGRRQQPPQRKPEAGSTITDKQRKLLFATSDQRVKELGGVEEAGVTGKDVVKEVLSRFGVESTKAISPGKFDEVLNLVENWDGPLDAA